MLRVRVNACAPRAETKPPTVDFNRLCTHVFVGHAHERAIAVPFEGSRNATRRSCAELVARLELGVV